MGNLTHYIGFIFLVFFDHAIRNTGIAFGANLSEEKWLFSFILFYSISYEDFKRLLL